MRDFLLFLIPATLFTGLAIYDAFFGNWTLAVLTGCCALLTIPAAVGKWRRRQPGRLFRGY